MANDIEELYLNGTRYGFNDERLATKAEQDGYYEEMTVGDAEQLVSTRYVNDAEPYNFRTTGGSADVGNRKYLDKIVGGTVAWNQMLDAVGKTAHGITSTFADGVWSFTGTATNTYTNIGTPVNTTGRQGHVFVSLYKIISNPNALKLSFTFLNNVTGIINSENATVGKFDTGSSANYGTAGHSNGDVFDGLTVKTYTTDLTQLFGTTIANYIYSLEQATAGAGVAWFKKLFPKDYYAYNAGQLMSVKTSAHNTVGFNQWDEQWENGYYDTSDGTKKTSSQWAMSKNFIKCFPNTMYCISQSRNVAGLGYLLFYDEDENYLGSYQQMLASIYGGTGQTFITPANCYNMVFYTNVSNITDANICINLSWSGYRNGEYEPYVKHEYALDSDLELRGIPKLDSANNLYYDGDTYEYDGTVNRRFGSVDLGTLNWTYYTAEGKAHRFHATLPNSLTAVSGNFVCEKPYDINSNPVNSVTIDNCIIIYNGVVWITDNNYSSASDFKTAMSGVMLVYELATPTTEEADPYQQIQICDDFGTEEFVDTRDIPVPVGHETRYPANLRDKLQHLPDLADADGYYMIQQSNNDMSLIRFRIPQAPAEDGEYTLKATVSGGTPTYTWESTESEGE